MTNILENNADGSEDNAPALYDEQKSYDAELDSISREHSSASIYVKLEDGTEDQFYVPEKFLRKGNYFMNTPPGTKMRVWLAKNKSGRTLIAKIEKNRNIPPRPHAATLPWVKAKIAKEVREDYDHLFLLVSDPCEFFIQPGEVYVTKRLFRNSGWQNSDLEEGREFSIRIIQTERGLQAVQIRYPEGFKPVNQDV